ncbi:MAG: UPF0280 family protein [Candidatus Bathyarchaeota archaeon]|nr:UPF0280 family protein [Candidatus Bathyarchaeota archaeon]
MRPMRGRLHKASLTATELTNPLFPKMTGTRRDELFRKPYSLKETKGIIISDSKAAIQAALESLQRHRLELENFCETHPTFQYTLEPLEIKEGPESARLMAEAGSIAGVGPMAAVAGVLADLAVRDMIEAGAKVAGIENGGEAYFVLNRPLTVSLQAGDTPLSRRVGFRLEKFPVGVATSSGRYSHALSLGDTDAVTVFASTSGLADAVATSVGNMIKDQKGDTVQRGVEHGLSIPGVHGVMIVIDEKVGIGGDVPRIINVTGGKNDE